uniref:J domain-containing protein n=1 Tax=Araucaria cunninghamii TaxID=56994 RepID=A0A0D6R8J3_ARACU
MAALATKWSPQNPVDLRRPRPARFSTKTKSQRKSTRRRGGGSLRCRCALPGGAAAEADELGYDLYDLLGVESTAEQLQIRAAYRWLQKKCHPDVAGPDGHHMAILLNEAYAVLSDPAARRAYDGARAERVEAEGFTGRPLYSAWFGPADESRAVFVDEVKCIGCLKCALVAPKTFAIETVYGRARAVGQWADPEDTVRDAIRACPVDCISWVEKEKLPALEFLMSKQPRVAVRMNANNSVGARVGNVFVDAERFLEKLRKKQKRGSKFQESPAQREARMAAADQIRTSAGWWWHHFVGNQAKEYINYQRALKGAIVPLNWERRQQFSGATDSDKGSRSKTGPYEYQRINVTKELSEAAARRRMGRSPSTSKREQAVPEGDYWVPVNPGKSSGVTPPSNNVESDQILSEFPIYSVSSGNEEERVNLNPQESTMQIILSGIPLATSAAAGVRVGFGSGGGDAGGLETHLAGPLALHVINSFEMHVFLAASFWYVVGAVMASAVSAVLFTRKRP